ncbi:MAG: 2-oxo acid dehydrogenase subunit E2 [Verrucomicrobiia bacterium]
MDIKLPNLGEGADSGVVVNIMVNEGDTVAVGQPLIEVETGKAIAAIPAEKAGKVAKILVKVGDKINVGKSILVLEVAGEPQTVQQTSTSQTEPKSERISATKPAAQKIVIEEPELTESEEQAETVSAYTPAAPPSIRRMARELGIDLRQVKGTGPGGRIQVADLRVYIAKLQRLAQQASKREPETAIIQQPASIDFSQWGPVTKRPMSQLRMTIAKRMVESATTIPQVTQFDEVDITRLEELRKKYASVYESKGARLTFTVFILKAVVAALKKHPIFNSSLDESTNEIILKSYYHIGIAVDTEAGLLVPVVRNVDYKTMYELSMDLANIAKKARDRKLTLDDMRGGTFTISNQGGIGGGHFTPIINKPEAAILGVGKSQYKPVIVDGKIEPRLMLPLAVSYDHRLIDGGTAARFITDLCQAFLQIGENDIKIP